MPSGDDFNLDSGLESPADRVRRIARRAQLPDDLASDYLRTTKIESGHNVSVRDSPKGAQGFGQVMPDVKGGTIRTVGGKKYNLRDPEQNIEAGLRYFAEGGSDPVRRRLYYFGGPRAAQTYDRSGRIPNISDGNMTAAQYVKATGGQKPKKDEIDLSAGFDEPNVDAGVVETPDVPQGRGAGMARAQQPSTQGVRRGRDITQDVQAGMGGQQPSIRATGVARNLFNLTPKEIQKINPLPRKPMAQTEPGLAGNPLIPVNRVQAMAEDEARKQAEAKQADDFTAGIRNLGRMVGSPLQLLPQDAEDYANTAMAKGGAGLVNQLAGAVRVAPRFGTLGAPNPLAEQQVKPVADKLNQVATEIQAGAQAADRKAGRGYLSQTAHDVLGGSISSAPAMGLVALGVPAPVAFGLQSYLEAQGRDAELSEILKETGKGVTIGALFDLPVPTKIAALGKIGERVGRAGIVGAGTFGLEKLGGAENKDAFTGALVNSLFAASGAGKEKPREGVSEKIETKPNVEAQSESAQPADVFQGRDVARTADNRLVSEGQTSEPVRHVDLQKRVSRGPNKGDFKSESRAEKEARRAQVAQLPELPQIENAPPEVQAALDRVSTSPPAELKPPLLGNEPLPETARKPSVESPLEAAQPVKAETTAPTSESPTGFQQAIDRNRFQTGTEDAAQGLANQIAALRGTDGGVADVDLPKFRSLQKQLNALLRDVLAPSDRDAVILAAREGNQAAIDWLERNKVKWKKGDVGINEDAARKRLQTNPPDVVKSAAIPAETTALPSESPTLSVSAAEAASTKATQEWGRFGDVVDGLAKKKKAADSAVSEMQIDAARLKSKSAKTRLTKTQLIEKYGVSNTKELEVLYSQRKADATDAAKALKSAQDKMAELAAVKDSAAQAWQDAATQAKGNPTVEAAQKPVEPEKISGKTRVAEPTTPTTESPLPAQESIAGKPRKRERAVVVSEPAASAAPVRERTIDTVTGDTKTIKTKPESATGLDKTQSRFLARALQENVERLPQTGKGESPITIKVPDDGEFTVQNQATASRLHQKITGKPIEGVAPAKKLGAELDKYKVDKEAGNTEDSIQAVLEKEKAKPTLDLEKINYLQGKLDTLRKSQERFFVSVKGAKEAGDYWKVTDRQTREVKGRFKTSEEASAAAAKLNKPEPTIISKAKARLAEREALKKKGVEYRGSGGPDTQAIIDHLIVHGYDAYQKGKVKFEDWADEMRSRFKDFRDQIEPHLKDVYQKLAGSQQISGKPRSEIKPEPSITSARKAMMADDRAELDLPELPKAERKSWQTALDNAKPEKASLLADEVLNRPRPLNDEETASLVVRAQEIKNEHSRVMKEIGDATDPGVIQAKRAEAETLEREFDKLTTATKKSGTEKGRALASQKLTINQDYDLVSMLNRAKSAKGRDLTSEERVKYEQQATKIADLEKQLADAQEKAKTQTLQRRIDKAKRQVERGITRKALDDEFADLRTQFAQAKLETRSGVQASGLAGIDPEGKLTVLIAKMARNRVKAGVVEAEALVDEVYNAVKDRLENVSRNDIRDTILGYGFAEGKEKSRQTTLLKREALLTGRLAQKDYSRLTPQREPIIYTRETAALQRRVDELKFRFNREMYRANRSTGGRIADELSKAGNIPKTIKSMGDVSAMFRQGGFYALTHPKEGLVKPTKAMLKSFTDAGYRNVEQAIKTDADFQLAKRSGVEFTGVDKTDPNLSHKEEGYLGGEYLDYVPVAKQVKDFSERTFVSFLDSQRMHIFKQMADGLRAEGMTPTKNPEAFKSIAKLVNIGTGRGDLGRRGNQAAPVLNIALFSPRLIASRVQLLNKMFNPVAMARMPKGARSMMIKDNVKFIGATLAVMGLAKAMGGKVSTDPDDGDFLKIRFGNTTYDTLTGLQQPMRYAFNMARAIKADTASDETYSGRSKGDLTGQFVRSKLSPIAGTAVDYLTGQDFQGRKFSAKNVAKDFITPLPAQDVIEAFKQDGLLGAVKATPTFTGIGVATYPESPDKPKSRGEKLARKLVRDKMPSEARTDEEIDRSKKLSDLRSRARRGEDVSSELKTMNLAPRQEKAILSSRGRLRLQDDFKTLSLKDAVKVYGVLSDQEKSLVRDDLQSKAQSFSLLSAEDQEELKPKLEALGMRPGIAPKKPSQPKQPRSIRQPGYVFQ